jgi:hypothetical protein
VKSLETQGKRRKTKRARTRFEQMFGGKMGRRDVSCKPLTIRIGWNEREREAGEAMMTRKSLMLILLPIKILKKITGSVYF